MGDNSNSFYHTLAKLSYPNKKKLHYIFYPPLKLGVRTRQAYTNVDPEIYSMKSAGMIIKFCRSENN